jgi:hypothetical protein
MKNKIFASIDPYSYLHHTALDACVKPDVFIVDYPSMITSRIRSKSEEERFNEYMIKLRNIMNPIPKRRREKIEEIINRLYDEP